MCIRYAGEQTVRWCGQMRDTLPKARADPARAVRF
jgi:hypothetical protein